MKRFLILILAATMLAACTNEIDYDASGNFEAEEVIVSAQQNGMLLDYSIAEGQKLRNGEQVGLIDVKTAQLQKEQVEASIVALSKKTVNPNVQAELVRRQIQVQQSQLQHQLKERSRTKKLVEADAATRKQLDDIDAQIDQLRKQLAVSRQQLMLGTSTSNSQNQSILSEREPLSKQVEQFDEQIKKGKVINPVDGTVLTNFALKGELQVTGKPLYKIANLSSLDLRAYISGNQLAQLKIGQVIQIRTDMGKEAYRQYTGKLIWVADKSEFSPKNIQTKDERSNLVYAIKVRVRNDGYLKIGMYGELVWSK